MIVQLVNADIVGDRTVASAMSGELGTYGWSASTGNLPAAYLTGLLAGRRAKERGIETAVLDLGLNPPIKGSRVYAALKGAIDAGLEVAHDSEILPDESRIKGQHIVEAYKHFKGDKGASKMFTQLTQKKVDIQTIPKQFETVKKKVLDIPAADLKPKKKAAAARAAAAPAKKLAKKAVKGKAIRKAPRAQPIKPRPKRLVSKGKGRVKGKKAKSEKL